MKSAAFVCLFAILISMLVLAQSSRAPLVNQPNGSPAAQPPHPGLSPNFSQMPQGAPFAHRGARAVKVARSRSGNTQTSGLSFANAVAYDSGGYDANSVAVADVNGDGKPDIVVANYGSATVGVLLGNGDGTFQAAVTYDTGKFGADSVAIADVNGDGKPDLLVADACYPYCGPGAVSVLLGNGDGTFQPAVNYDSGGYYASSVAVADVNGDGKPDLLVTNWDSNNVGVLLGNGDGTFQTAVSYSSGGSYPYSVAVADVNGDGRPDIVVANCVTSSFCFSGTVGTVGVLLGNGDGTFQTAVTYGPGGSDVISVAVADVNGDGKPDIVVANDSSWNVGVLLGNGDGTFQTAETYSAGGTPYSAAVADVNGDGNLDVVVADYGGLAGVLLGNGDGTFQTAVTYGSGGWMTTFVAVADVNGDGKPDLIASNSCTSSCNGTNGTVGVLINTSLTPTTTAISSSQNPSNFGQPVTFTATVTAQRGFYKGTPTGTVSFYDGTTLLGTGTLNSGVAAYSTSVLNAGSNSMTATYGGDTNFVGSTSGVLNQVVNEASTTTGLTSSLNPSSYGQAATFTATVTGQYGGTPTGTVSFYDGTTLLGTGTLNSGVATYSTSALSVGTHSMTAVYGGDTNFLGSTSGVLKQVVNQASTTTGLTSSPNPSSYGQTVTFTATVTGQYGGTPTGTVSFYDGTTLLGTGTLSGGVATYSTSALGIGSHSMTAVYGGDTNFLGSTSGALSQVVNQASTTTGLSSSQNPSNYGQTVTFTAKVAGQYGGTPTGTVSFYDGTKLLGTGTLNSGVATYSTSALSGGSHSMTAVYGGDTNFLGSTSGVLKQWVKRTATTTSLASSKNPSKYGQTVTFTATVTGEYGGTPSGPVTFKDGNTVLAKVSLNGGVAKYSTKKLKKGKHTIEAIYSGNVDYKGSSASLIQTVN